jgi:3-methyladenine DNA glycosylase AlkD
MLLDAEQLLAQLKKSGTRMRAENEKRYLKSGAEFFGVTVPTTRRLAKPVCMHFAQSGDLADALAYTRKLWATKVHEPRVAAVAIVAACAAFYDDRVWDLGRRWLAEIDNWALCDGIGPHLLAPFICTTRPRHKSRRREIIGWTRHANPWIRRGALLSTLKSTRVDHECDLLFDLALRLLRDEDYFVQKGLGWMLRECAHHRPREVITFIQCHRGDMRKSTITNAVSRLPKTLQRAAREGEARPPERTRGGQ